MTFAAPQAKSAMPATPTTIKPTIGMKIEVSISGVQSFKPSKTNIVKANIKMLKELQRCRISVSKKPNEQKTTPKTKAQTAPLMPVKPPTIMESHATIPILVSITIGLFKESGKAKGPRRSLEGNEVTSLMAESSSLVTRSPERNSFKSFAPSAFMKIAVKG